MKTINYTGSSKLISRIVNLLNRKAPLPLDGDGDPDWGSNGQVLSTDGSGNTTWVNQGGGSGGHTIWGRLKATLTQRGKLWFADANASDVSADDATKVEVVTELLNETAFDNLATDGTADGIYTFPDSGGEYLTAAMSSYDNTASGLTASNVQDAIDELARSGGGISYSQTERIIGTWIDGKPLYQKTFVHIESKTINYRSLYIFDAGMANENLDMVVYCQSIYDPHWESGMWRQNYPSYYSMDDDYICLRNDDSGGNSNQIDGVIATLRYTKTTDTP